MIRFLTIGVLALFIATAAPAAIVQFTAIGTISGGTSVGPGGLVQAGDPARFDLVYDTSVPDSNAAPFRGQYAGAFLSAVAQFGTNTVAATSVSALTVHDGASMGDLFTYFSQPDVTSIFGANAQLQLEFMDGADTAFSSDALPTTPIEPAAFSFPGFGLGNGSVFAIADASSVTILTPVPLPAGGALLAGGLALAAIARRRRRAA